MYAFCISNAFFPVIFCEILFYSNYDGQAIHHRIRTKKRDSRTV